MNSVRHVLWSCAALAVSLCVFSWTPADLVVQRWLFPAGDWLWPRHEPVLRFLLYDGLKAALVLFFLSLLVALFRSRTRPALKPYRSGMRIVALSMLLVPGTVGALKSVTNVACPRKLELFGGGLPYANLLEHLLHGAHYATTQRCFPAGHASGGFALLSLVFLFKTGENRLRALFFALALGWTMGLYKMAIGDHFLSHTVVSMLIAWLLVHLVRLADDACVRYYGRRGLAVASHGCAVGGDAGGGQ